MGNVQKLKLISPIAAITIVLFVAVFLLAFAGTGSTFAFVVEGGDCGLVVNVADDFTDVSNLNPGDTKSSYLIASNTGEGSLTYFFDIEKRGSNASGYKGQEGKHLDEILQMTMKRGEETLFEDTVSNFAKEIPMGQMAADEEQQLNISVYFPGGAGNEYQGSDVTVRFKFRAVCGAGGDEEEPTLPSGDDDDDDTTTPPSDDEQTPPPDEVDEVLPPSEEELEVPPETPGTDIPGEEEPPGSEDIKEPEKPGVQPPGELEEPSGELEIQPKVPKTGEFSRPAIYGIGLLLILAGLLLHRSVPSRKRG